MEKIFDKDVQKYLKESGVSDLEIERIKYATLRKESISILKEVSALIEEEKYNQIENYVKYSPSGDGFGCENYYIDFGSIIGSYDGVDIRELSEWLSSLKTSISKKTLPSV